MKILLCAATEMEVASTIQFLSKGNRDDVTVLISGVGLMAATYALAKSVATQRPDLLLQAGVAGTLTTDAPLGRVVAVQRETVGDLGVQEGEKFRSLFDLKLLGASLHPWKDGSLVNDNAVLAQSGLPAVNGITVNEISTDERRIDYYRRHLGADVETMEGAALHYVGLSEKIPFLQIRSLSNFIGERNKTKWTMKEAVVNLNRELQKLITILTT